MRCLRCCAGEAHRWEVCHRLAPGACVSSSPLLLVLVLGWVHVGLGGVHNSRNFFTCYLSCNSDFTDRVEICIRASFGCYYIFLNLNLPMLFF
ncbi:hypothetical protein BDA96_05G129600 [Sorghum bicolor]|uniref:Uncharacterized protein n=2 Tax=Sorghum bicolor TaxID=4558 RepID=A0A1B6PRT3_SORBI|nr:hypothetical protein BDA96_05G129600 [Sorghum bicolor]KXG28384.1 hypothetical protein SORBI_3005G116800 [Sorghum bicolor]